MLLDARFGAEDVPLPTVHVAGAQPRRGAAQRAELSVRFESGQCRLNSLRQVGSDGS